MMLTTDEVVKVLDITRRTLITIRNRCVGPAWHKFAPKSIRYDIDELNEWLDSRRGAPNHQSKSDPNQVGVEEHIAHEKVV